MGGAKAMGNYLSPNQNADQVSFLRGIPRLNHDRFDVRLAAALVSALLLTDEGRVGAFYSSTTGW